MWCHDNKQKTSNYAQHSAESTRTKSFKFSVGVLFLFYVYIVEEVSAPKMTANQISAPSLG